MSDYDAFILPFDSTGRRASNHIPSNYTILTLARPEYQQITLKNGLFYKDDLKVIHLETNTELVEGIDFRLTYQYGAFKTKLEKDVYAAILILNKQLTGNLTIIPHYVGGDFSTISPESIPAIIDDDPTRYTYAYDSVLDTPIEFPVTSHGVHTSEANVGFDDVVVAIKDVESKIEQLNELPPTVEINQVNGLEDELKEKLTNNKYTKIATNELLGVVGNKNRWLHLTVKKPKQTTTVSFTLKSRQGVGEEGLCKLRSTVKSGTVALEGDRSKPLENARADIYRPMNYPGVYSCENSLGGHYYIGPFINEEGEVSLTFFISEVCYSLGIDPDDLNYTKPIEMEFLEEVDIPSTLNEVERELRGVELPIDITDVSGLEEVLKDAKGNVPWKILDTSTNTPEIKACRGGEGGYYVEIEEGIYTIKVPKLTHDDEPVRSGDTFTINTGHRVIDDGAITLTGDSNTRINGLYNLKINTPDTTVKFTAIQRPYGDKEIRDWRITGLTGDYEGKDDEVRIPQIVGKTRVFDTVGEDRFDLNFTGYRWGIDLDDENYHIHINGQTLFRDRDFVISHYGDEIYLIDENGNRSGLKEGEVLSLTVFVLEHVIVNDTPYVEREPISYDSQLKKLREEYYCTIDCSDIDDPLMLRSKGFFYCRFEDDKTLTLKDISSNNNWWVDHEKKVEGTLEDGTLLDWEFISCSFGWLKLIFKKDGEAVYPHTVKIETTLTAD